MISILRKKRKAELAVLQAQINPHFLYNTLESINWMALSAKQKNISRMVLLLSNFMRLSLNKGKNVYTIRKEVEHLRTYIEIQQIRHKNKFQVIEDIDENILDYYTIKLILQPIIENCIVHGFKNTMQTGTIEIYGGFDGEDILFTIRDNGCGMDDNTLKCIFDKSDSKGYGIKNVNERIKLYFGEKYGLEIESSPGKGTTVKIRIPKCNEDFQFNPEG